MGSIIDQVAIFLSFSWDLNFDIGKESENSTIVLQLKYLTPCLSRFFNGIGYS